MTLIINTTPDTGRSGSCTPLCKDPSRRGTRRLPLAGLIVQADAPDNRRFEPGMSISISTQDGRAMQLDLDAPTSSSFYTALSVEMSRVNEGHAPCPQALTSEELSTLKTAITRHVEGIALVSSDNLLRILTSVRLEHRTTIATLLVRMRPDLLTPVIVAMAAIG